MSSEQDKYTVKIADIPHKVKPQLKGVKNVPIAAIEKRKLDTEKIGDVSNEIASKVRKTESVSAQIVKKTTDYQFDIQNVSQYLLAKIDIDRIRKVYLSFHADYCIMEFNQTYICIGGIGDWHLVDKWLYGNAEPMKVIKTADPEKSIIDHLWLVLNHPNLELNIFTFAKYTEFNLMNFKKLNSMLLSMFNSLNHQIHASDLSVYGFDVDTFGTILKHCKPGTLRAILLNNLNKVTENDQKMKEIVKMDQWKRVTEIELDNTFSLTFDHFLQCEKVTLFWTKATPADIVCVRDHCLNSPDSKLCDVVYGTGEINFDEIEKAFGSGHLTRIRNKCSNAITYYYPLQDLNRILRVRVEQYYVSFRKMSR